MTTSRSRSIGWHGVWRTALNLVVACLTVCATESRVSAQSQPIATVGLTSGWATFGEAVPKGVAASGLQVGNLQTQTDVKNRWPDGSIRFAILTVNVPTSGNYAINPATIATGSFMPFVPAAAVNLTIAGETFSAVLPATPSTDLWLSGPLLYEGRSLIAPISSADGAPHPFLRVNFDTRVYNDGAARVDVSVENVLDKVGATTVTYDATISVSGQTVFTKTGVQHFYLTRWRKVFEVNPSPFASVTPDTTPFNQSGALPPYSSIVANQVSTPTGVAFDILRAGGLDPIMSDHSGRAELAPLPDWTARYLVHKNLTQRSYVLANGDLSGSLPIHMREAENSSWSGLGTERLVSIDQRPRLWLDERAQAANWDYIKGTPLPMREYGTDIAGPGQSGLLPDNAHQPSIAYVPYLLTGDRYYAEEMAFWANYAMVRTYPADGLRGSQGILQNNEVRGYGWALRNLADAAAYYPDSSAAVKAYLSEKVLNNLRWLDNYVYSQDPIAKPFQILWTNRRPDGAQYISLWEQTYLAYGIGRANQQGFPGGLAVRDATARFHLKLFTSEPDYPRAQAGAYLIAIGTPNGATLGTFYTTMAQIWAATDGQQRPFAGFYGPEARLNLMVGIENGWPGAQAAYDFLWPYIGVAPVWPLPDLGQRAGWALDFASTTNPTPAPAQITNPPPGSTLTSTSQIFNWNPGVGVTSYRLDVGTAPGAGNIYSSSGGSSVSAFVSGLPTSGTIWVRLTSSLVGGVDQHFDYSYTGGGGTSSGTLSVRNAIQADGYGPQTTPPFNTSAGDLIVAMVASSGPSTGGATLTVSGGSLTWTLVKRVNGQRGVSEIWTAKTPTARSGITVTSIQVVNTVQSLVVVIFSGAAGTGASAGASAPSGAPSVSLTTTGTGSLVYGVGNDWNGDVPRTLGANQTMVHEYLNPGNDTFWTQNLNGPVASAGTSVQLNDTAPIDHEWNFAAVEIVPRVTPPITWPDPASMVYPAPLSATQLNASSPVAGTFLYTPPIGTVLGAGTGLTLLTTFTPTDQLTYQTVTKTVRLDVLQATPTITWPTPADIISPTPLGATQLNATADVPGTFVYTPGTGTVLSVGAGQTLSVTFTPTDPNYGAQIATVSLNVRGVATITRTPPAAIVSGTPLSATQLNATANVPGSLVYSPAAGTVLPAGPAQPLLVKFTPTDTTTYPTVTASVPITVLSEEIDPPPTQIGSLIAGTFKDATGHSGQSHLVYAPNAGVWWLFTLSSAHDSVGDHTVRSYFSSGPNLATATWTQAAWSPDLANVGGASNSVLAGGRSLGVAQLSIGGADFVHLFASAAFDGQVSSNGHIRAQLGATSITWGSWNNPGSPNTASEWQGPANSGNPPSASASHTSWGNSVGISTPGRFVHHFSVTMDQEVDCSVGRSANADTAALW